MHLKSIGAICARTLSYEDCEFELVENASNEKARIAYNSSAELWGDLVVALGDRCAQSIAIAKKRRMIEDIEREGGVLTEELVYHQELHADSDTEDDDYSGDEDSGICEQKTLRRKYRNRASKILRGLFWSANQVSDNNLYYYQICIP